MQTERRKLTSQPTQGFLLSHLYSTSLLSNNIQGVGEVGVTLKYNSLVTADSNGIILSVSVLVKVIFASGTNHSNQYRIGEKFTRVCNDSIS